MGAWVASFSLLEARLSCGVARAVVWAMVWAGLETDATTVGNVACHSRAGLLYTGLLAPGLLAPGLCPMLVVCLSLWLFQ